MNCEGYRKLVAAVEEDGKKSPGRKDEWLEKLDWIVQRAKHYAEKTNLPAEDILDSWEKGRDYWYMNYYQECNQPEIKEGKVRVFETIDDMLDSIGRDGFRCPHCSGKSTTPYSCNSGVVVDGKPCDWKVWGLFKDLGKGVFVFIRTEVRGERIFMPIAWEKEYGGK